MNFNSELAIENIREFARRSDLSKTAYANLAGIPDRTLKDFWEKEWNPTMNIIRRLESVIPNDFILTDLNEAVNRKVNISKHHIYIRKKEGK